MKIGKNLNVNDLNFILARLHHLSRPAPPRAVTMKQPMMALTG